VRRRFGARIATGSSRWHGTFNLAEGLVGLEFVVAVALVLVVVVVGVFALVLKFARVRLRKDCLGVLASASGRVKALARFEQLGFGGALAGALEEGDGFRSPRFCATGSGSGTSSGIVTGSRGDIGGRSMMLLRLQLEVGAALGPRLSLLLVGVVLLRALLGILLRHLVHVQVGVVRARLTRRCLSISTSISCCSASRLRLLTGSICQYLDCVGCNVVDASSSCWGSAFGHDRVLLSQSS